MIDSVVIGRESMDSYYVELLYSGGNKVREIIARGVGFITASVIARRYAERYGVKVVDAK